MVDSSVISVLARKKINLILLLGIILLIAFFSTTIASFFISRDAIRESIITTELPMTSDNIYTEIQKDLLLPLYISSTMANDTFLRDWILEGERDPSKITRYLSAIKEEYNTITSFLVSESSHNYYFADGILKEVSPDDARDVWYFRVRSMSSKYEINVDPDMANKDTITIFINYRVQDFNGRFLGATGVGLTVDNLKRRINEYKERFNREIYFIGKDGKIILTGNKLPERLMSARDIHQVEGLKEIGSQVLANPNGSQSFINKGDSVLLNYRYIPELDWILMVEQEMESAIQPLRNVFYINIVVCIFVTMIVLAIITRSFLRHQRSIEKRNIQLEQKNQEIAVQKEQLERANSRLEALNQEKDEFLSIAAHDLKSPLSGIVSTTELILSESLTADEIKTFLTLITQSAADMLDLITNLLDLTAIEMADSPTLVPNNIVPVIKELTNSFVIQAKTKQMEILTDFPSGPVIINSHQGWLGHIVSNLISNAIKFSPMGSTIKVNLSIRNDSALIAVIDQGPGFTTRDKDRLFTRFARLSAKPTGNENSSGLGLYIVKKLTLQMGGTVWCDSGPEKGSIFYIEFP